MASSRIFLGYKVATGGASPQTLTPDTATATATAYDAALTATVTVTPDAATATAAAYDATITPGTATITPDTATATAAAHDSAIVPGAVTITPAAATATASAYDATISASVTLTLDAATSTAAAYDSTLIADNSPQTITPATATATASAYDTTLVFDQALTPTTAEASATAHDATLTISGWTSSGGGSGYILPERPRPRRKQTQREPVTPKKLRLRKDALLEPSGLTLFPGCALARGRAYPARIKLGLSPEEQEWIALEEEVALDDDEAFERFVALLDD
jgi:hypothetical protein